MQVNNSKVENDQSGGFTADTIETSIGGEILESLFGAAVGSAFGIELPDAPGGYDLGNVVDIVDEFHKNRDDETQKAAYVLGQKTAITHAFNFGTQKYCERDQNEASASQPTHYSNNFPNNPQRQDLHELLANIQPREFNSYRPGSRCFSFL